MKYIQKHMWADTEPTAGILDGRWDRHVWEDALSNVDEATKKGIDPKLFKKWLSITTNKLFETQLALSRHRIKLSKRLKDRIFERPKYIHPLLKKQLIENNAVLYIPEQERENEKQLQTSAIRYKRLKSIYWKKKKDNLSHTGTSDKKIQIKCDSSKCHRKTIQDDP